MKLIEIERNLLQNEATSIVEKFKNILAGAFLYIIWASFVIYLYMTYIPDFTVKKLIFSFAPPPSPLYSFIASCILAPLWEEIIYRVAPISLARILKIEGLTLLAILASSVLFGLAHQLGPFSLPIQGVGGLIFCYVYIKNGYSYISSVLMHFIINFYFFLN